MIDPAILRRGRFDHVIDVGYPGEEEVKALIEKVLADVPKEEGIDWESLSRELADRPLSDVAFVLREGARLAGRSGRDKLDGESLRAALASAPPRQSGASRRIGFS
jgi:SpoVK/Ycf46/Vps4 family AAA+-type ATPase